ncbi:MAG TPA: DUF748 domain-containing protein [Opitutaceae bacterium]|nr:DUF748 domain-containing protein [Opitutaceae bacterium]
MKHRSLRRRGLVAFTLLALYTVTGFFILPPIVRSQLEKRLSAELGRRVTVEKLRLNPFTLSVTVENFAIREQDGTTLFLGWQQLYANFGAWASLRREWVLSEVVLQGFEAQGRVHADHSLNISDLLAKFAPPANAAVAATAPATAAKPGRPVRVGHLHVSGARIELADLSRSRPFTTTIGPMTFDLSEFRTVSERGAPYRFAAVTEAGEKLAWSGTLRADPFQSVGELVLEDILLSKYAAFYADLMQAEITTGKLSMRARYTVDLTAGRKALLLQEGAVQLRGLSVRERGSEQTALELPSLDVAGVEIDALEQKASIASVTLAGGHVRARREKDGSVNLLKMLTPAPAKAPSAAAAAVSSSTAPAATAPAKTPDAYLGELVVKDFQVEIADLAAPRPTQLALRGLQFSLKDFTLSVDVPMPVQLAFNWAPQGTVRLAGTVGLAPVKASLKGDIAGFEILPLSPYLEQFMNARLTQGTVSATFAALASLPPGKPLEANVTADVTVEKLGLVDGAQNAELAGFSRLTLRGLQAATTPALKLALDEIDVAGPYARIMVNADKTLNLATVAKPAAAPTGGEPASAPASRSSPTSSTPAAAAPVIEIGKISISEGDFRFTDRSLTPAVSMAVAQFGGTISGLSSTNPTKADVDLKASVDGVGPVAITGKLDPLGEKTSVDLRIAVQNMDLQPLSPYSAKYAGYELARGKLLLDVKLLVDGKKIDATNVVTLNQFTFGNPANSPEATKLPVRLGVALLKDMDGKIVIDVPVQGNTDDPSFRVGRVVLRVIVNLLTKAAVSPFSLLGAAFGGGGDELAFQEFEPGLAALQEAEIKKLETMTKALTNRPGLSLDIEGSYDPAADAHALKYFKFDERVRRAVWEKKRAANPNIPPPSELAISPEEALVALRQLFDAAFPPGTEFGAPLAKAPVVVAPPAPPKKGFVRRTIDTITFRRKRTEPAPAPPPSVAAPASSSALPGFSPEEMAGRLAETMVVDDNDLRALAQERAQAVRTYFTDVGKIAPDRLFLSKEQNDATKAGKGPRVFLHLQ